MDPSLGSVFEAFSNHLVWRKVGSYLNYSDLKDCRLVCKDFNRYILKETNFKARTVVTLQEKDLCENGFGTSTEKWKNINILPFQTTYDFDNDDVERSFDFRWLSPLLADVEILVIGGKHVYSDAVTYPPLQCLLEAPQGLKSLSLDVCFLCKKNEDVFTSPSPAVYKTLEGLSEFVIDAHIRGPVSNSSDGTFFDSIEMIGTKLNNLQMLRVANIVAESLSSLPVPETVDEEMHSKLQNLLRIIEKNRKSIASLQLHDTLLWSTSASVKTDSLSVTKMSFPLLKAVKIRMTQHDAPGVIEFLNSQPLLEEVDLTVLNLLPNELLRAIGERSNNLKRLRIATKGFEDSRNHQPSSSTWTFLSKLERLTEFQLNLIKTYSTPSSNEENCVASTVCENLPTSVKRITLRGLPNPRNPLLLALATDGVAVNVNINPAIVTVLSLSKCLDCVNDEALEFICKNFKSLISLNLSDVNKSCTDYGFTGLPLRTSTGPSQPFSIADIKGLKSLTLRACGSITDLTLIEGIKFLELRFLDVCNNPRITPNGCLTVLRQNPSLEVFQTGEFDDFPSEEELQQICPRLKQHTYPHDDYSEDEDASVNDFESDFSGGGYNRFDDFYDAHESEDFDDDDDYDNGDENDWI